MRRRDFVRGGVAAAVLAAAGSDPFAPAEAAAQGTARAAGFKHSVSRWCYGHMSVDELAQAAKRLGMHSVELLEPEEWAAVRRHGLTCAVANAPGDPSTRIPRGFNRLENHEWLIPAYRERIPMVAEAGIPNLICFSGNRDGLSNEKGLENCARGLRQLIPEAERHGVMLIMELLNSRVDHPDYQCDRTPWGVELVERVGSEHFRLLYDIYHMQIMEGDVIRTIRDNHRYIAHYHTAGVPGRNEIDETQELNYRAIARAIAETGFQGYLGQEFIPTREPLTSLAEAVRICSV